MRQFVLGAGTSEVRWSLQLIGLELPDGQGSSIAWLAWIHYHWALLQPQLMQTGKNDVWPTKGYWTVASIFSSLVGQSPYLHSWDNKTLRKVSSKPSEGTSHGIKCCHHLDLYCLDRLSVGKRRAFSGPLQQSFRSGLIYKQGEVQGHFLHWVLQWPHLISSKRYRLFTSEILNLTQQTPF